MPNCKEENMFFDTCKTKIGKGNHEITAIVDLYKMDSNVYNFAKIRFMSGSTCFVGKFKAPNRNFQRIYIDDERRIFDISKIYGGRMRAGNQVLKIKCLMFSGSSSVDETSKVTLKCGLTDKFGLHELSDLEYDIAKWKGDEMLCDEREGNSSPKIMTKFLGKDKSIIAKTVVTKYNRQDKYNCVAIEFIYKPYNKKFTYNVDNNINQQEDKCSKNQKDEDGLNKSQNNQEECREKQEEVIYLFNKSLSKTINLCINPNVCDTDSEIKLTVNELNLQISTESKSGEVCIKSKFEHMGNYENIDEQLAKWSLDHYGYNDKKVKKYK